MNVGLYHTAAAMNAYARWQEMMAENLSTGSVPGFKRQEMTLTTIAGSELPVPAQEPQRRGGRIL